MNNEIYKKQMVLASGFGDLEGMKADLILTEEANCFSVWVIIPDACYTGALYAGAVRDEAIEIAVKLASKFSSFTDRQVVEYVDRRGFSISSLDILED